MSADAIWERENEGHICLFYQSKEDLAQILIPYFRMGLENNELCIWVVSSPGEAEKAKTLLRRLIANFESYDRKGQIEIRNAGQWYLKGRKFDPDRVLISWCKQEQRALKTGLTGLRAATETSWLGEENWQEFMAYESRANDLIRKHRISACCCYSLEKCGVREVVDVISRHDMTLIKEGEKWKVIRNQANIHLDRIASQTNKRLQILQKIIEAVHSTRDVERIFKLLTDEVVYSLGYTTSLIILSDEERKSFTIKSLSTKKGVLEEVDRILGFRLQNLAFPVHLAWNEIVAKVLRGQVAVSSNLAEIGQPLLSKKKCRLIQKLGGSKNYIILPLVFGGETMGAVFISSPQEEVSDEELGVLKSFAVAAAGAIRNASLFKQTEQAKKSLEVSERRFRELWDHAPVAYHILDKNGIIIDVNETEVRMLGYSKEEMKGRPIFDFILPEQREEARERFKIKISGRRVPRTRKRVYVRKDGSWIYVDVKDILERDEKGVITGVRTAMVDVTEREKAEASLRESEERFHSVVEHSHVGIVIIDDAFRCIYGNDELSNISGYSKEEIVGRDFREMLRSENEEMIQDFYLRRQRGESVPFRYEINLLRKNGEKRRVEVNASTFRDSEGRVRTLAQLLDVTERKKAEENLYKTFELLRKMLGGVTEAITRVVEIRDPYTAGHQRRVADLARGIAQELGLCREKIDGIRMAGLIHDIGKISIPAEILNKPGGLSEMEFQLIKNHVKFGYEILRPIEFEWPVAQIILQHHERLDGSGYPSGLRDEEILLEAKILAVADVVEAMLSHRPYRPAHGIDKAMEEIFEKRGVLYDAKVVDACLKLFKEKRFHFREEAGQL